MKKAKEPKRPDIYVSIDGEFTGRIPGPNSMISFGAVAYTLDGNEVSRFKTNLRELPGSTRDPVAMRWWKKHPRAWKAATKDPLGPNEGMAKFAAWLKSLPGEPKLLGWPLPVDFLFVYWYYWRFVGEFPPFGFDGLDVKSFAAGMLGVPLSQVSREFKKIAKVPFHGLHHDPLCDAEHQGRMFFALAAMWSKPVLGR